MHSFAFHEVAVHAIGKRMHQSTNGRGTANSTLSRRLLSDSHLAAVSRLRLQRATQLSTPGLRLDRCSLWTTYMGSETSVHRSGQRGNPEGNLARGLEFLWGSLRLAASLKEGLSFCQGWTFSHLPPTPFVPQTCVISVSLHCHSSTENSQLSNFSLVPHFELSRPCIFCCGLLIPCH